MKTKKFLLQALVLMVCGLGFQSCLKNDGIDSGQNTVFPNGIVTVKTASDKTVYLQLDDKTTLLPINMKKHPFDGKEVRALLNFNEVKAAHNGYSKAVNVNWIDSIMTKGLVPHTDNDNEKYGHDAIDILRSPVTAVEDGYLTLRVRVLASGVGKHQISLVRNVNPKDPYTVELRHNAFGNFGGRLSEGYVAFRLHDLPSTQGKPVKLTIKWKSTAGEQMHQFDYISPNAEH